jgi:hypothetical protein
MNMSSETSNIAGFIAPTQRAINGRPETIRRLDGRGQVLSDYLLVFKDRRAPAKPRDPDGEIHLNRLHGPDYLV